MAYHLTILVSRELASSIKIRIYWKHDIKQLLLPTANFVQIKYHLSKANLEGKKIKKKIKIKHVLRFLSFH